MRTDPVVTVVVFAAALIVFCACAAIVEGIVERRDRRAARDWNRALRRRAS